MIVMLENIVHSSGFEINSIDFSISDQNGKALLTSQSLASRNLGLAQSLDKELIAKIMAEEVEKIKNSNIGNLRIISIETSIGGGGYSGFKSLVQKIEQSLRLMDLNSFTFSTKDKKLSLKLTAYYLISQEDYAE